MASPAHLSCRLKITENRQILISSLNIGAQGIAITPDGQYVYIPNAPLARAGLFAIRTSDHTLEGALIITSTPGIRDILILPNGQTLYMWHGAPDYSLSTMRLPDNFVDNRNFKIPGTDRMSLRGSVVSADSSKIYAFNTDINNNVEIIVISTADNTVGRTISLDGRPSTLVLSPDETSLYSPLDKGDTFEVAAINLLDNDAITSIPLTQIPAGAALTPDGRFLYVAIHGSFEGVGNVVEVIDTELKKVIDTINVPTNPGYLEIIENR